MMNKEKIKFTSYYGKTYKMTLEELEAAFFYMRRKYRIEDATNLLYDKLGYEDSKWFKDTYGVPFELAEKYIDNMVDIFEKYENMEIAEADLWESVFDKYIEYLNTEFSKE